MLSSLLLLSLTLEAALAQDPSVPELAAEGPVEGPVQGPAEGPGAVAPEDASVEGGELQPGAQALPPAEAPQLPDLPPEAPLEDVEDLAQQPASASVASLAFVGGLSTGLLLVLGLGVLLWPRKASPRPTPLQGSRATTWSAMLPPPRVGRASWTLPSEATRASVLRLLAASLAEQGPVLVLGLEAGSHALDGLPQCYLVGDLKAQAVLERSRDLHGPPVLLAAGTSPALEELFARADLPAIALLLPEDSPPTGPRLALESLDEGRLGLKGRPVIALDGGVASFL